MEIKCKLLLKRNKFNVSSKRKLFSHATFSFCSNVLNLTVDSLLKAGITKSKQNIIANSPFFKVLPKKLEVYKYERQ